MAKSILTLLLILLFAYFATADLSVGNKYYKNLVNFNNAVLEKNWDEARHLERILDKKLVKSIKESNYPEYLEIKIQRILSQNIQTIDTTLEVAKLYSRLGDKENTKLYLEKARSIDPIRQDIKQALLGL